MKTAAVAEVIQQPAPPRSLIAKIAERFSVEPGKLMTTLKATAFKSEKPATDEQMMALLIVADQYRLNPFTKEVYAFPDKNGGIVPVVGVDGWSRIINEHPMFDGMTIAVSEDGTEATVTMWRKDRSKPTVVTEYLAECKRGTQPWGSHPRRMLRHKAMIQCARIAFGYAGIYDEDEAARIIDADRAVPSGSLEQVRKAVAKKTAAPVDISDATVIDEEPPVTYAQLADLIQREKTRDDALLVLDQARHLPADQQTDLRKVVDSKFLNP